MLLPNFYRKILLVAIPVVTEVFPWSFAKGDSRLTLNWGDCKNWDRLLWHGIPKAPTGAIRPDEPIR
jgi:hypothetical protein